MVEKSAYYQKHFQLNMGENTVREIQKFYNFEGFLFNFIIIIDTLSINLSTFIIFRISFFFGNLFFALLLYATPARSSSKLMFNFS